MQIIARGRMGGKTTVAAEWVKGNPERVLLVIHEAERQRVIRLYSLDPKQVIVADGAVWCLHGRRDYRLGVDNMDMLGWRTVMDLAAFLQHTDLVTETR